eukprot:g2429.t1
MSKKRGLSLEDKRERLLEVFHESCDVFVWKEVEKLATKKGITPQSIKDVLQSLVDDDLVHQEKIGSANYFWSFPSETSVLLETEVQKLNTRIEETEAKKISLKDQIQVAEEGREDSESRKEKIKELSELTAKVDEIRVSLLRYRDNDPELFEQLKTAVDETKASANRWLENIFALQSWCSKKFIGMESELKKFFNQNGITDDTDYIP